MSDQKILVVEDDPALSEAIVDTLSLTGYQVVQASDGTEALQVLANEPVDLMLTDLFMQPMHGETLLKEMRARNHHLPVIVMTAHGSVENAVDLMKQGAIDYLSKPFEVEVLLERVGRYLPLEEERIEGLVAEDVRTRELADLAARIATSDVTVMIGGESGTGKEVFARYIHAASPRAKGPFVAINCAAIPENMLEAVLFGHEKGAYTGAYRAAAGKFEQAQSGTLLLDEVSEMPLALQAKLLRVLQEREVERVGGRELIPLDVRVLATSNRNLREEVAAGRFREDLFYRLNVFPLSLPPLRERPRDIVPLARALLKRHLKPEQVMPSLSDEAVAKLVSHKWSGNVRELDNLMQRALILSNGREVEAVDIHFETDGMEKGLADISATASAEPLAGQGLSKDLKNVESEMILEALRDGRSSRKEVAEKLGISPRTLRYKLAKMREAGVAIPA